VLLVSPAHHDRPVGPELVLHLHDLTGTVGIEDLDDVQRVVQDHLRTRLELVRIEVGSGHHTHLPAGGHHVDRAVLVGADEDPEGGGGL
jgi:hypothetical protein